MATGINGIITRGEANALLPSEVSGSFFTSELTRCPTMQELLNASYQTTDWSYGITIGDSGNYTLDQLVKASSCTLRAIEKGRSITVTMQSISEGTARKFTNDWVQYQDNTYQKDYSLIVQVYSGSTYLQAASFSFTLLADRDDNELWNIRFKNPVVFTVTVSPSTSVTKLQLPSSTWYAAISSGQYANVSISPGTTPVSVNWPPIVVEWLSDDLPD